MVDILQGVAILALALSHLMMLKQVKEMRIRYVYVDSQVGAFEKGVSEET